MKIKRMIALVLLSILGGTSLLWAQDEPPPQPKPKPQVQDEATPKPKQKSAA